MVVTELITSVVFSPFLLIQSFFNCIIGAICSVIYALYNLFIQYPLDVLHAILTHIIVWVHQIIGGFLLIFVIIPLQLLIALYEKIHLIFYFFFGLVYHFIFCQLLPFIKSIINFIILLIINIWLYFRHHCKWDWQTWEAILKDDNKLIGKQLVPFLASLLGGLFGLSVPRSAGKQSASSSSENEEDLADFD